MLWIDQPVGTGFSSAGDESAYCTDDLCSAKDLYSALEQITAMFPQYKHLRITGESYGGKWVPSAASYVLRQQQAAQEAGLEAPLGGMTLAGISIGDGWTDPINMLPEYIPLLNYVGILDEHGLASFGALMQQAIANTTSGDTAAAFRAWDAAINGDLTPGPPLLERLTGLDDYFNYDRTTQPAAFNYWSQYVVQPAIRQKLGVGDTPLHDGLAVEMALISDFMLSQADNLIFLLDNNIPALVYVGQLDIIVGPALVDAYLKKLQWKGLQQYLAASRGIWKTADEPTEVAGWARVASPLTHVVVRNVGHIAPFDDPQRMFNLITAWADGKPLTA